jgi:RNA polymerase sigma-54 factor
MKNILRLHEQPQAQINNQLMTILSMSTEDIDEFVDLASIENPFIIGSYKNITNFSSHTGVAYEDGYKKNILNQINLMPMDNQDKIIAKHLAHNINNEGFLTLDIEVFLNKLKFECGLLTTSCHIRQVVAIFQQFIEPIGVGARNIIECFTLQLQEKISSDVQKLAIKVCQNHLHLIDNKQCLLTSIYKTSVFAMQSAVRLIKSLDKKPGLKLLRNNQVHSPSITIIKKGNIFNISANTASIYVKNDNLKDTNYQLANNIKRNIKIRNNIILKVGQYILQHQLEFMQKGPTHLKPLNIRDLCNYLNIHKSLINNFIEISSIKTPQGIFPIRYFFKKLSHYSISKVKNNVKMLLIKNRNISSEDITKFLQKEGLKVSFKLASKYKNEISQSIK